MVRRLAFVLGAVGGVIVASAQSTWCGKHYRKTDPIVSPGGNFVNPVTSSASLLAFRCSPGLKPYLESDISSSSNTILVDIIVTHQQIAGTSALPSGSLPNTVTVQATTNGKVVASGSVPLNATKYELSLSLSGLTPSVTPYTLQCSTTVGSQTFKASSPLSVLPNPTGGSAVKMDLKTGALLAKPATGQSGDYKPVFSLGYYTNFGGYLASNLSVLDEIKADGFTIVHPVPTFDNLTALDAVLDRMQELGLYLMYDFRWDYTNLTAVNEQVDRIKSRPNLLLWYTADEPDGWGDALNATTLAYNAIYKKDQGYHPVSLVLNCQDYYYSQYAAGADILMQDAYMIGNNVTFSSQWGTPCTPDYGDCGCDNCKGSFKDISDRMDQFSERNRILGWDLTKSLWTVPQAFGEETYWKRKPTGKEWTVEALLAVNHGARGVISWNDPTTPEIKAASSALAKALLSLTSFLFSHTAVFTSFYQAGTDLGVWKDGSRTLIIATNLQYTAISIDTSTLGLSIGSSVTPMLNSGATIQRIGGKSILSFESVGSGAWIFSP